MENDNRLRRLEERYAGYKVRDIDGQLIGTVDALYLPDKRREGYIGVKIGMLGVELAVIPMEIVRVDTPGEEIIVSAPLGQVDSGPR